MLSTEAKKLRDEISKIRIESERAKDEVIVFVRGLVLTLKDRGCAAGCVACHGYRFWFEHDADRAGVFGKQRTGAAGGRAPGCKGICREGDTSADGSGRNGADSGIADE